MKIKILAAASLSLLPLVGAAEDLEEIIVKAHPLSDKGLAQDVRVLTGDELASELQSSLGETVAGQPGVRSASFGGAVGRPVIHGLGGARVKTTEDRIDSLDASVTSTDHAVTVEPFVANQITVLKGASTLLYGSGAIGGVVDTETGRIPTELPDEPVSGRVELRLADNGDAKTGAVRLDGAAGDALAWHLDAFSKEADDYEIPGEVESAALRASEGEEHDEEEEGEFGLLEGSRYDISGGAVGLSWVQDGGFIGFSVSTLDADYGLIGGHGHEEEEGHDEEEEHGEEEEHDEELEEEGVGMIGLEQTRFDIEAGLNNPFAGVKTLNFRLGVNDYEHTEFEGNGEVGTVFDNQAWEGRLELSHEELIGFDGTFGLQLSNREFSALGEEAFVPPVETDLTSAFWVGERDLAGVSLETGVRFEEVKHRPSVAGLPERDFSTGSASIGVVVPQNDTIRWSALLDYSERAPSIEELYSNGPHLATQSFEIGDTELDKESGLGLTLTWVYESDGFDARASLYHTRFDDFIFEVASGEEEDELPVFVYQQRDADFTGIDIELGLHLAEMAGGDLDLKLMGDWVKAEVSNPNQYLPRIPATRVTAGLDWQNSVWRTTLKFTHVFEQDEFAQFELPTESYNDVSFRVAREFDLGENALSVFFSGRNITDEEQRQHTSFLKDVAPAPGRRLELGVRLNF